MTLAEITIHISDFWQGFFTGVGFSALFLLFLAAVWSA